MLCIGSEIASISRFLKWEYRFATSSTEDTPVCRVRRAASCLYLDSSASMSMIRYYTANNVPSATWGNGINEFFFQKKSSLSRSNALRDVLPSVVVSIVIRLSLIDSTSDTRD